MSFFRVCRLARHLSADVGPVTSAPKSGRSRSASRPKIVETIFLVKQTQDILLSGLRHGLNIKSICFVLLAKYFETEEGYH